MTAKADINQSIQDAVGRQLLIDSVLRQIVLDVSMHDLTAIEELLRQVPEASLKGFLPDGEDK